MSGPICPDCGLIAFRELKFSRLQCKICGWKGKGLPRKIMSGDKQNQIYERTQQRLKQRDKGELFCLRIWLKGDDDSNHDVSIEIMELLEIDSISGDEMLFLFVEQHPDPKALSKIKKLKGVKRVKVY